MSSFILNRKIQILKLLRRVMRRYSINRLKKNGQLWQELMSYRERSKSTLCSYIDLWTLYDTVRTRKPKEILECGPGISTLVMSYALMENSKEGFPGRITAMEELEEYHKMEVELHPEYLKPYVEWILSPRIEDCFYLFRGVKYRDVPDKPYDFVFVDGPHLYAPSDNMMTFDFDFINVVKNSRQPVYGIVDYRLSTSFVFQVIFGLKKVKFDAIRELAFLGPCSKDDLIKLDLEALTKTFLAGCALTGNSEIKLR